MTGAQQHYVLHPIASSDGGRASRKIGGFGRMVHATADHVETTRTGVSLPKTRHAIATGTREEAYRRSQRKRRRKGKVVSLLFTPGRPLLTLCDLCGLLFNTF
jgi:type IV secretory pathway TrbL component